jgi:hypothetical protein
MMIVMARRARYGRAPVCPVFPAERRIAPLTAAGSQQPAAPALDHAAAITADGRMTHIFPE